MRLHQDWLPTVVQSEKQDINEEDLTNLFVSVLFLAPSLFLLIFIRGCFSTNERITVMYIYICNFDVEKTGFIIHLKKFR
jgi:hypothetical protein